MLVSNGLVFTFLENQKIKNIFAFIASALKLPGRRKISDKILPKFIEILTKSITKMVQDDKIGVTAVFDKLN